MSCQHPNRPGRKFCAECGANLAAACSDCGFGNYPDEKFCGGCGKALQHSNPVQAQARVVPGAAENLAERRQISVLF